MKFLSLLPLALLVLLWLNGCAFGPTLDEQSRYETQQEQEVKRSDAFARDLPQ